MITKNWTSKFIALVVVCFLAGAAMGLVGYRYFLKPEVVRPEFSPPPRIVTPLTPLYDFPQTNFGPLVELHEPIGDIKYLKVEFAFPGTVFEIGEKKVISPRLINTGDRPVTISHGDPLFWVVLEDKERGLKWIPARAYTMILVLPDELESGESYYYNEERIILIEGSPILEETPRYTLEPGIYTLHVYAEFSSTIDGTAKAFRIYAPSIQIEIRE